MKISKTVAFGVILPVFVVAFLLTPKLFSQQQVVVVSEKKVDLNTAYRLMKEGQYQAAADIFVDYLRKHPTDARILLEVAYLYVKLKNDQKALSYFQAHLRHRDTKPEPGIYLDMAYLSQRIKQWHLAQNYFVSYLEERPENLDIQVELAYQLIKNGKKQEALQRMQNVLQKEPERDSLRLNMAYLLYETDPNAAYPNFRILAESRDPEIRKQARQVLKNKPATLGYFIYAALYHSFRFDINVLDINSRVYLKKSPIKPIEPYLFLTLSTDAESTLNPFPTIYSEQAAVMGAGLQWYFYKRSARIYIQYGYRKPFLDVPGIEQDKGSLSYGLDSFFRIPLAARWYLELNNTFAYHSRFDNDFLFEGKEVIARTFDAHKYKYIKPYAGILIRWDSKDYFYNNNYELLAGISWSWRKDFTYQLFCEYRRGTYREDTIYGRHYNEWIAGIIVGIYR